MVPTGIQDEFRASPSNLLSPSSPRKSPSRQSIHARRSAASLRTQTSLGHTLDEDANGRHSLAHELAVALMPEPSAGSKMLADEFGIEYDEGAEGIDDGHDEKTDFPPDIEASLVDEMGAGAMNESFQHTRSPDSVDLISGNGDLTGPVRIRENVPTYDAIDTLAQDFESTDKFLAHLRRLDIDSTSSSLQPSLEKIASDIIRRLNETARDREEQVRELLEYEREFRRIGGEIGGNEVLGALDELEGMDGASDRAFSDSKAEQQDSVRERPTSGLDGWENNSRHGLSDEVEVAGDETISLLQEPVQSHTRLTHTNGDSSKVTPIPQLALLRTFTSSLVTSLSVISEQAQVNGAATTEAGRKIRALKNKIGGWRIDWDSAEKSRLKIEKWEAGEGDIETLGAFNTQISSVGRVDGRKFVQQHLQAFEQALIEAGKKTQAIMSVS